MAGTITLAYYNHSQIMVVKSVWRVGPEPNDEANFLQYSILAEVPGIARDQM